MYLLDQILPSGCRVIDIGANRGVYSYHFARRGLRVHAFEPNVECFRGLKAWSSRTRAVEVHRVALSSERGSAVLRVPVDRGGLSHDASGSIGVEIEGPYTEQAVSLRTLDSFGFSGVTLLKIDVEGHESRVLSGARRLIDRERPVLLTEIEQRHIPGQIGDVIASILQLGYHGFFLRRDSWVSVDEFHVVSDQLARSPGQPGYINNFLFLDERMVANGSFDALLRRPGRGGCRS
jgi:FkbM family methyltransferase